MHATQQTDDARTVVEHLSEGDVIRVGQYDGALRVTTTGDLGDDVNAFVGVEFTDDAKAARGADKSLITNASSKRVYLTAGTTDKGEVTSIERVNGGDAQ